MTNPRAGSSSGFPGPMPTLLLAAAGPAVLVAIRASLADGARLTFLAGLLYWTMPVVLALAAGVGVWCCRSAVAGGIRWRAVWPGAAVALALTVAVFVVVPPAMRVQFDETSLVGVSQNMHSQRAALMTTGAVPYEALLLPLENTVDKRPPLFAFLVSLAHDVSGSRIGNAFAVNGLLLFLALWLVHDAVRARLGGRSALAAPPLLLAVPLTSVVATSAGFELLAGLLFVLVVLQALAFVRQPDPRRWIAFVAAGLVFAQARYESLLVVLALGAGCRWAARGRWQPDGRCRAVQMLCPALLTPVAFLLLHAQNPNFYPEAAGAPLVSLQNGLEHVGPFLAAWFAPGLGNPLPGLLAICSALLFARWLAARRGSTADLLVVGPVALATCIALSWFYGDVREPTALRLFLPAAWLSALGLLLLPALYGARAAAWLLPCALALCGWRLFEVHRGVAFPPLAAAQLTAAIDAALLRFQPDRSTTLWVATPAQHLIVKGHAALSPEAYRRHFGNVRQLRAAGHVRDVLVVQTPLDAQLAPAFGDPGELLRAQRSIVAFRTEGPMAITVHRLVW